MATSLRLVVCRHYVDETRAALASDDVDVSVSSHADHCARGQSKGLDALAGATRQELPGEDVVVLGACFLQGGAAAPAEAHVRVHRAQHCLHLLVPQDLVAHHVQRGAFVVTPGWLADWPDHLARWGFDADTARAFFHEGARGLVLFDTGVFPDATDRARELSATLDLPLEVVPVGLEPLRGVVRRLVLEWRLRTAHARAADYALAFDLLGTLARPMTEDEARAAIVDLGAQLFGADSVRFVSPHDGRGDVLDPETQARAASEGWAATSDGFAVRLSHRDEVVDTLVVEGLAFPERRRDYVNLALGIAGPCGLAVANARASTRIRQTEDALRASKDAAEAATLAKSRFLAHMSHEIRTPMNAVLGYAQVLRRDPGLSAEQARCVDVINRSGEHLLTLLDQVLEISRIEAGRETLNLEPLDLHEALRELEVLFGSRAEAKHLTLSVEAASDLPRRVRTDPAKLRQVLINLVGNALKFTDEGGVYVRATGWLEVGQRGRLSIQVIDTGPGIAPEDHERVFRAFEQARAGSERGGTGLGLAISRQYAQMLGGDLTLASAPGEGSVFTVELVVDVLDAADDNRPRKPLAVARLAPGQGEQRVLVVDDVDVNREFLERLLTSVGFTVRQARDGNEALAEVAAWSPRLVFMDVRMPGLDGLEATRRLRARPEGRGLPIVMVSASALDHQEAVALECGGDAFLRKPLREDQVLDELRRRLGVEYVYAGTTEPERPVVAPVDPDAIARVPAELRLALRAAAEAGYLDTLVSLTGRLHDAEPALATSLETLARTYRYDDILDVVPE